MSCPECEHDCSPYNIRTRDAIPVAIVCNLADDVEGPEDPSCLQTAGTMCFKTDAGDQEVETIPDNNWIQTVALQTAEFQQLLTGGATVTFTMDHLTAPGGSLLAGVNIVAVTPAPIDTFRLTWDQPLIGQFTVLLENVDIGPTFNIVPAPDVINPAFGPGGTHQLIWNDITGITQIDFDIDATVPGADVINLSIDETVPLTIIAFVESSTTECLIVSNICNEPPTFQFFDMSSGSEITDPDAIASMYNCDIDVTEEEVCVTVDDEHFTCIKRTFYASDPVDVFIGPDGAIVNPDSWIPGICDFETVTGYIFDCLRFDNNLPINPINSNATFDDTPVGTNQIIFEVADVALLIRGEIEKAQQVQAQETLHSLSLTSVVVVTDSGETYEFYPDALQSGTGSTLVIDETGIISWGINQTDIVTELQYSVFDSCDCKAVEVLQWIKDSNEVYLLDVFDITYDQSTGQKISLLDENRLLDFLTLGPFAGPCPTPTQVMEVNPLCCNDDLLQGSEEIAEQRLAWLDASDETLMRNGGTPITGTTGEDVDEVWDKLQPGIAPSFVVPANVAPGDNDPPTAPTFVESGLNDLSVLNFDSSDNDRLRLDTGNPSNGPFTLFYLVSATDIVLASQACILAVGPDNSDGDQFNLDDGAWQLSRDGTQPSFIFRITGPSIPAGGPGTDPTMIVQTGPYSAEISPSDGPVVGQNNTYQLERAIATEAEFFNGQFHLITVSYDDVNQILSAYFDGELRLQMDMSVMVPQFQMASDYFRIFGNRTGAAYLSGQLAEMFFADSFLSPEETAEVNSYLICKWGIDPSIVAGGLGDLELDTPGSYSAPSPFVQIVESDGTIKYVNTLNGQEFALPPTPGLALCEDPTIESVELQNFDWMKQLCDRIETITGLDLFFFNDANQDVQRVNAFTGDVEDSHSPDPAIDWAHGTVFDASGGPNGYYYLYDAVAAEWHRYDAGNIAAGSVNLGVFGGDPIVGSFTFGAFDPTTGLAYVGFVDQTRYEVDFNTSTITALPVFNGHTGAPSSLSITETGLHYMTAILAGSHTILHTVDVATGTCTPAGFFSDIPLNGADYDQDTLTGFYGIGIGNLYRWTELDGSDLEVIAPAVFSGTLAVGNTVISTELVEFQRVYHKDLVSGEVTSQDHDLEGADYEVQGIAEHCPVEVEVSDIDLCAIPAGSKVCYQESQEIDMSLATMALYGPDEADFQQFTPDPNLELFFRRTSGNVDFGQAANVMLLNPGSGTFDIDIGPWFFASGSQFSIEVTDIDAGESIIFSPAPDSIGPTGDGITSIHTWNDASVLTPTISVTLTVVDGIQLSFQGLTGGDELVTLVDGESLSEAFVSFDCDGIATYRDTVTNEVLVNPVVVECTPNSCDNPLHVQQCIETWSERLCDVGFREVLGEDQVFIEIAPQVGINQVAQNVGFSGGEGPVTGIVEAVFAVEPDVQYDYLAGHGGAGTCPGGPAAILVEIIDDSGAGVVLASQTLQYVGGVDPPGVDLGPTTMPFTSTTGNVMVRVSDQTPVTTICDAIFYWYDFQSTNVIRTEFQRVYHKNLQTLNITAQDHDFRGNLYELRGTAMSCQYVTWSELLCDESCVTFHRVYHKTLEGEVTYQDHDLIGQPFVPTGKVDICVEYPPNDIKAHLVNLNTGETWTPASVPLNHVVTGLSMNVQVEAADSSVTDADGNIVTNIPAGQSMSWNVSQDYNTLIPPQAIFAGTGGRIMLNITLRDDTP